MIVQVRVVFRKTVVGDLCFDYLSGSHLQSQVKSLCQMMVFMPLVLVWIGQFCRGVIALGVGPRMFTLIHVQPNE